MEKNTKIISLDVLRGLACLAVLVHHVFMINPYFLNSYKSAISLDSYFMNSLVFSPLKFVWDGHAAVILFFVLSGFVLSISFFKKDNLNYKLFFIKRMCRIYLPYVALIIIGSICSNYFLNYVKLDKFTYVINGQWIKNVSVNTFFDYIFFVDNNMIYLSNSIWSLPVELKVSLFLPFVIIVFKKIKSKYDLVLILVNMIIYHGGKRLGLQDICPDFSLFYFLTFFMAGIVLYKHHQKIVFRLRNLNSKLKVVLYIIALLLYTNYSNLILFFPKTVTLFSKIAPGDYLITVSSVLFMLLILSEKENNFFLSNKYVVFLGKISFSLYLIHPIIMMLVCLTLGSYLSFFFLHTLCILLSLIAAIIFYKLIELPTQKLGFKLSKNLN